MVKTIAEYTGRDEVGPKDVADYLNSVIAADARAMWALIAIRVPCNDQMAKLLAGPSVEDWPGKPVHVLTWSGLLNGLLAFVGGSQHSLCGLLGRSAYEAYGLSRFVGITAMAKSDVTASAEDVVAYLNLLCEADPLAMRCFLCVFTPCNEQLAEHPTCIVNSSWGEGFTVSMTGFLNGLFKFDPSTNLGKIAYIMQLDEGDDPEKEVTAATPNKLLGFRAL